jgi:hypothetical protein
MLYDVGNIPDGRQRLNGNLIPRSPGSIRIRWVTSVLLSRMRIFGLRQNLAVDCTIFLVPISTKIWQFPSPRFSFFLAGICCTRRALWPFASLFISSHLRQLGRGVRKPLPHCFVQKGKGFVPQRRGRWSVHQIQGRSGWRRKCVLYWLGKNSRQVSRS